MLRAPSVAGRVAAAGGEAAEADQRAWSADAFHAQEAVLARLAGSGVPLRPERRYTRALNGFAAALTAVQIVALERDPAVAGVYPSRRAAALAVSRAGRVIPRLDGSGVTVAVIGGDAVHAAALAARVAARAPGVTTLPVALQGPPTTEWLLAALERTLDPDGDGDCHDAARIVLLGVVEPLAALPDAPSARAVAGALALDAVVVVPVGENGGAGLLYGSRAGPAGSPAVLVVAAVEVREGAVSVARGSSAGRAPGAAGPTLLAPGRRSAAAGVTADVALLVQARPGLGARTLRSLPAPSPISPLRSQPRWRSSCDRSPPTVPLSPPFATSRRGRCASPPPSKGQVACYPALLPCARGPLPGSRSGPPPPVRRPA